MVQGQVLLKEEGRRGGGGSLAIYFFQVLSFLHIEIILFPAKLCYTFEEKNFFSANIILWQHNFMKKAEIS